MDQADVVRHAIEFLKREQIPYAVVGSVAAMAYGESRMTNDLDVLVDVKPGDIPRFLQSFPSPEWYVSEAGIRDALRNRRQFNVIHPTSGHKIDFMLPRSESQVEEIARALDVPLDGDLTGRVAHPHDVIAGKLRYYAEGSSPKHLRDIQGILAASGGLIDRDVVAEEAASLGMLRVWEELVKSTDQMEPLPPDFS